jgi:hypothetical protein
VSDTPQLLLAHHLKALRLPGFLREYDKLAQQCAAEGIDHPRYLLRLARDRDRRGRREPKTPHKGASFFPLARYCIRCTPGIGAQTTKPPYRGRLPPVDFVAFSAPWAIMPRIGGSDKQRWG